MSEAATRGKRVVVTSPDGAALCVQLCALGWEAHAIPTVAIRETEPGGPFDIALQTLETFDWIIITSARGAAATAQRLRALNAHMPSRPNWVAVGPATAAALEKEGIPVAFVPEEFRSAAIPDRLGEIAGTRILLPRADAASPELPRLLRERGAHVVEVTAYRTIEGPEDSRVPLQHLLARGIDAIVFTSGSAVRGFARLTENATALLTGVVIACVGPVTADAVRALGLSPTVIAEPHTTEGLVRALLGREEHAKHH